MVVTADGAVFGCLGGAVQTVQVVEEDMVVDYANWRIYNDIVCKRKDVVLGAKPRGHEFVLSACLVAENRRLVARCIDRAAHRPSVLSKICRMQAHTEDVIGYGSTQGLVVTWEGCTQLVIFSSVRLVSDRSETKKSSASVANVPARFDQISVRCISKLKKWYVAHDVLDFGLRCVRPWPPLRWVLPLPDGTNFHVEMYPSFTC